MGCLDCTHCGAAVERTALNASIKSLGRLTEYDVIWAAYNAGKAKEAERLAAEIATLKESLRKMWGYAIDLDEMGYFSDDKAADRAEEEGGTLPELKREWQAAIGEAYNLFAK